MGWFKSKSNKGSSDIAGKDPKGMMALLGKYLEAVADDLNETLDASAMKLVVSKPTAAKEKCDGNKIETTRVQAANNVAGLSVRARDSVIEAFQLPADQLFLVPSTEYPSRLKFKLERHDAVWILDGKELTESDDLKLLVLTVTNDLLKQSFKASDTPAPGARLRIGEFSLTTGLRDLLFEKAQLLSDLVNQQELLQSQLAAELHDSAVADLMLLRREINNPDTKLTSEKIGQALDEVMLTLREICAELSSRELKNWGLSHSLAELCQRRSLQSGHEIEFSGEDAKADIPFDAGLHIYRITQETLNNAIKHASANHIRVKLEAAEREIAVTIEDDGIGFSSVPTRSSTREGGMGLPILKERAEMLTAMGYPASLTVNSQPGSGTTVMLRVWWQEKST